MGNNPRHQRQPLEPGPSSQAGTDLSSWGWSWGRVSVAVPVRGVPGGPDDSPMAFRSRPRPPTARRPTTSRARRAATGTDHTTDPRPNPAPNSARNPRWASGTGGRTAPVVVRDHGAALAALDQLYAQLPDLACKGLCGDSCHHHVPAPDPGADPAPPTVPVTTAPTHRPTLEPTAGPTSPDPEPVQSAGLDPQFGTCKAAIAAGYGPYTEGVDPEYDWYRDSDHDGIDC